MIGCLLTTLVLAQPSIDVSKAEALYEQARYEAALGALGASCAEASEVTRCEQVRAFVLMALGREPEARAAFERMLVADAEAQLPPDVSPKMLSLFDEAHKTVEAAGNIRLNQVDVARDAETWELAATVPAGAPLMSLTAYLSPASRDLFLPVELRPKQGSWAASFKPGFSPEGGVRYYLVAVLDDGTQIFAGSREASLKLAMTIAGKSVASEPPATSALGDEGDGEGGPSPKPAPGFFETMPRWGWYAIIGGAAAVVATGVVIGVLTSGDEGPGDLKVNIRVNQ